MKSLDTAPESPTDHSTVTGHLAELEALSETEIGIEIVTGIEVELHRAGAIVTFQIGLQDVVRVVVIDIEVETVLETAVRPGADATGAVVEHEPHLDAVPQDVAPDARRLATHLHDAMTEPDLPVEIMIREI